MSESEITEQVRKYRAIIIFANHRTGSNTLLRWFVKDHKKYTDYDGLVQSVKDLGYSVDGNILESDTIFDSKVGVFKDVINQYHKDKNLEKLELAVKTIMAFRPSFTIINEDTDIELIQIISKFINYYHFSAIFLYRRKAINRLLSLWFNANKSKKKTPAIDVDYLINNEKTVIEKNKEVWSVLQQAWCRYVALSFEDMYSEMADSTILHITFRWIFYNLWDFTELKQTGKSNLDKYYYEIKGIDKLEKAVDELPRPTFSNMHVDV